MRTVLLATLLGANVACSTKEAVTPQTSSTHAAPGQPLIEVSYMVDTVSREHKEVLDLWRTYLQSEPQHLERTPLWSQKEIAGFPRFDLAGGFLYATTEDMAATRVSIFQIAPVVPGDSSEYVIRSMFTRPDNFQTERRTFLHRVYAMRENGRWVLSNALTRTTRNWKHTEFDRITYVHAPGYPVDTMRARAAVRFGIHLQKYLTRPIRHISPIISQELQRKYSVWMVSISICRAAGRSRSPRTTRCSAACRRSANFTRTN